MPKDENVISSFLIPFYQKLTMSLAKVCYENSMESKKMNKERLCSQFSSSP